MGPVTPGRHAAEDGSFGRSAGMAAGRGAFLLAAAVILGVVLLNAADDTPGRISAGRGDGDGGSGEITTTTAQATTTTTAPPRKPADVKVLSANGTRIAGAAARVRDTLRTQGYNVLAPLEARNPANASVVYFTPTFDREGQAVAQALRLGPNSVQALPNPPPVPDLRGADVVVVVGPDLARRPATTTTTGRSRGTTTTTRRS